MSLRGKVLLLLSASVLAYAAADQVLLRSALYRGFVELERDEAHTDVQRVVEAIDAELAALERTCQEWARGDGLHDALVVPDGEWARSRFGDANFVDVLRLDVGLVCTQDGRVVHSRMIDPESGAETTLRKLPNESIAPGHPILRAGTAGGTRGIYSTERGALLVAVQPIVRSDGMNTAAGVLVLGRFLRAGLVSELGRRTNVEFEVFEESTSALDAAERSLRDELTARAFGASELGASKPSPATGDEVEHTVAQEAYGRSTVVMREESDDTLLAYTTLPDLNLAPTIFVRARVDRAITRHGRELVRYAAVSTLAASALLMLVLTVALRRMVLGPLARLSAHALRIGRTGDLSARLDLERDDELGTLSREFDDMTEKLAESRQALGRAARAAGMSEIANGVLHNVGNVLNSVNVSATIAAQTIKQGATGDLRRMLAIVTSSAASLRVFLETDPRGEHFQPMLEALGAKLEEEQRTLSREVEALNQGLEHIKELVRSQQSFAGRSGVLERLPLARVIEQAVSISQQALDARGIELRRDLDELPEFSMDGNRLLEILVNLLQNAKQALLGQGRGAGRITIGARLAPDRESVRIHVEDDGPGIAPENLTRIFQHGFTTKPNGHGFGLHTSANAATEMRGRLWAESAGLGQGARFVLEIPLDRGSSVDGPAGVDRSETLEGEHALATS